MGYEDFRPQSKITTSKDSTTATRTIRLYAEDEVQALLHANAPKYGDMLQAGAVKLYCNNVEAAEVEEGVDENGLLLFDVTATYQTLDRSPTADKARWSVGGQNEQAKRFAVDDPADQTHYYDCPEGYTGEGINITEDGAEGVDVDDPVEVLRIDRWMLPSAVGAYLNVIRNLRNRVNDDVFEGPWGAYPPYSVRFNGFSVSHVNGELDEVSLEFLYRDNVEFDVTVKSDSGSTGTITKHVTKNGQQYYWQRVVKQKGSDDKQAVANIIDAHVATLYREGDFSAFGITYEMFDMETPS